ncbi:MAG: dienelactone hydrolase family protein [Chloroflexota bacterium]|nr:dienelactone hydrolase family protein [Chloroflexota bacterium]
MQLDVSALRVELWRLLGALPPIFTPDARILDRTMRAGIIVERFAFDNGDDVTVPGYLLIPPNLTARAPAILYHHLHGNRYTLGKEEVFWDGLTPVSPALTLAQAGFVVLCIDAYGFGERAAGSPHIRADAGTATEQALYKHYIWRGSTLWGMMLRDDILALNYLTTRAEVDPARIGATGMSLGGSRTTWLAALDDRIAALVPVAQMTRYADFAAAKDYNLHGIYYYLPGMLASGIDMEQIAARAAPRPQTILIGDSDPLSPVSGVRTVVDYVRQIYAQYHAADRFNAVIETGIAHQYTPTMLAAMLNTFERYL